MRSLMPLLQPVSVSRLLRAIAAERHAAPPPCPATRMVGKEKRAGRSFAGLHVRKIFRTNKLGQRLADRGEQGFGRAPSADRLKLKRLVLWPGIDPLEGVIALQQTIQRLKPGKTLRRQRTPLVLAHKASEPLAQAPRLIGDLVEFTRKCLRPNALEYIGGGEPRLAPPVQQAVAVIDPVDRRIDRRRD